MSLDLSISNEGTILTYSDATGVKHTKSVDLSDFIRAVSTNVAFDMGFLPAGTRYLGVKGDQTQIAVERPAASYDVCFGNTSTQLGKAHLPAALFLFTLTKANDAYFVNDTRIFALKQDNVMLAIDPLYQYPTPNVYEDSRVCWGYNEEAIKNFKNLSALNGVVRRFFTAPFNHDLFRTRCVSGEFPWSNVGGDHTAADYLKFLTNQPFKPDWLVPHHLYNNFDAAIKGIFRHGA